MASKFFKETTVYKKSFALAMEIFEISKSFPKEEKYSLTDQIRRASRSVCTNIAEAYRKKKYVAHFISKVTDSDMENSETNVWLDFSLACLYIDANKHASLIQENEEIGKLLTYDPLIQKNTRPKIANGLLYFAYCLLPIAYFF